MFADFRTRATQQKRDWKHRDKKNMTFDICQKKGLKSCHDSPVTGLITPSNFQLKQMGSTSLPLLDGERCRRFCFPWQCHPRFDRLFNDQSWTWHYFIVDMSLNMLFSRNGIQTTQILLGLLLSCMPLRRNHTEPWAISSSDPSVKITDGVLRSAAYQGPSLLRNGLSYRVILIGMRVRVENENNPLESI